MFEQEPPERLRTDLAIKGIVICAVGVGISFGLCALSVSIGQGSRFAGSTVVAFVLSFGGMVVCAVWAVIAAIVNAFRS